MTAQRGSESWVLFGARTALAIDIAETVWRRGDTLAAVIDNIGGDEPLDPELAALLASPGPALHGLAVCLPQSTPGHRHACEQSALEAGFTRFTALIDPSAVVARTADIGDGAVVCAGTVIAARARIGSMALVNRSASIGHHASVSDYASIGPRAVLAGMVAVGRGAFIGAGAVVAPEVTVGANAVVGAGAVVVKDVEPNTVVVGNPARVLRVGIAGHGGVGVP